MNIDEMPAGRELDALVAERVIEQPYVLLPHYSTDIAAAWDIITRMNDAAFLLERSLTGNESWCARFGHHEDGRLIGTMARGTASTPALAICRAALKLWEGK